MHYTQIYRSDTHRCKYISVAYAKINIRIDGFFKHRQIDRQIDYQTDKRIERWMNRCKKIESWRAQCSNGPRGNTNVKKWGESIHPSIHPSIHLCIHISLFIYLSVFLCIFFHIHQTNGPNLCFRRPNFLCVDIYYVIYLFTWLNVYFTYFPQLSIYDLRRTF